MKNVIMSVVACWTGLSLAAIAADGRTDVTAKVSEAVKGNVLSIAANNGNFGDPQPGGAKSLTVEYKLGNEAGKKSVKENEVLEIMGSADKPLAIIKASYGMELEVVDAKLRGADERTPSRSEYFTWINNYDNGPTEKQTLSNLAFFKWLYDEYGMVLDMYAFDVGALDGGGLGLEKRLIPSDAVKGIAAVAATMKTRLGVWTGADGYGNSPEQEAARRAIFVSLCRVYNFTLFKFDGYSIGGPRKEALPALAQTLKECRAITPDLICLNHRLELGPAAPMMTTKLWEGAETYVDVHSSNPCTAPHHRAGVLSRGVPPNLTRLVEDHGVCLSSCLDYWEDDMVLQAFNRSLILAPEMYGNPWFLRDSEYPLMARLFNLHRRYNHILVDGVVLPEKTYGINAVSRGDGNTRFVTLRNLSWTNESRSVKCDASIGLIDNGKPVERKGCRFCQDHAGSLDRRLSGAACPARARPVVTD